ncbi:hypothetical protein BS333_21765 (plasmid) [Vibrio azureus]|nr:hypothetical protein BS333_21765 [Vibrio azureus]
MYTALLRTIKLMSIIGCLSVVGMVDVWSFAGVTNALMSFIYSSGLGFLIWFGLVFALFFICEMIKSARSRSESGELLIVKNLKLLVSWYCSITKKQRNIIWISALIICAIPIVGWMFVTPWLIPLMLFLEYKRS